MPERNGTKVPDNNTIVISQDHGPLVGDRDDAATNAVEDDATINDEDTATVKGNDRGSDGIVNTIWDGHEGFQPNPKADFVEEFNRLADFTGWSKAERKEQRPKYIKADFAKHYNKHGTPLSDWQNLCRVCEIVPIPQRLDECVEVCNLALLARCS